MMVRRTASLLVALLLLALLPVVAGTSVASAADNAVGRSYVPADRGQDPGEPGDDEMDDEQKGKKAEKPEPCPVDLWTIGLPVEGLACVLLFPKTDKETGEEEPAEDERGDRKNRR